MYDFIYKNYFIYKNVHEMGMGEKKKKECKNEKENPRLVALSSP